MKLREERGAKAGVWSLVLSKTRSTEEIIVPEGASVCSHGVSDLCQIIYSTDVHVNLASRSRKTYYFSLN